MDNVLQRTSTSNLRFSYNKGKREKFTKAKNGTILHEYIMCIIKDKRFEYRERRVENERGGEKIWQGGGEGRRIKKE